MSCYDIIPWSMTIELAVRVCLYQCAIRTVEVVFGVRATSFAELSLRPTTSSREPRRCRRYGTHFTIGNCVHR